MIFAHPERAHSPVSVLSMVGTLLIILSALVPPVQAQTVCTTAALDRADLAYSFGRFSTTFSTLQPCLPDGFSGKENTVRAYRLMALSYVATDSLALARTSIKQILQHDSGYRPDPTSEPPIYVNMVNDEIPEWYTFMWKGNTPSRWLARGAVVGAIIAIPLLLRPAGTVIEPDLPGPPVTPTNF
jgi:hypothetical protein